MAQMGFRHRRRDDRAGWDKLDAPAGGRALEGARRRPSRGCSTAQAAGRCARRCGTAIIRTMAWAGALDHELIAAPRSRRFDGKGPVVVEAGRSANVHRTAWGHASPGEVRARRFRPRPALPGRLDQREVHRHPPVRPSAASSPAAWRWNSRATPTTMSGKGNCRGGRRGGSPPLAAPQRDPTKEHHRRQQPCSTAAHRPAKPYFEGVAGRSASRVRNSGAVCGGRGAWATTGCE